MIILTINNSSIRVEMNTIGTHTPCAGPMYHYETLREALEHAQGEGYVANFSVTSAGLLDQQSQRCYSPSAVTLESSYRVEGLSDPADQVAVHALRTDDGLRGTLIQPYGPAVDEVHAKFIDQLR